MDSRTRTLERAALSGDLEAAERLAAEKRRTTPVHPNALLVARCSSAKGAVEHVVTDRRTAGEIGPPRWEALCHRSRGRKRALVAAEEPRWAGVWRAVRIPMDLPPDLTVWRPEDSERVYKDETRHCSHCYPGFGDSWELIRIRQLLALGIASVVNQTQRALFTGGFEGPA